MDDDDADYMQGSEDEVYTQRMLLSPFADHTFIRITASTTLMTETAMREKARMSKICIIRLSVCRFPFAMTVPSLPRIAKKEDDPEQALKEFRAIVDKEEEKGDWYNSSTRHSLKLLTAGTGDSRRSNSRQNCCSLSSNDQTRPLRHIVNC